MEEFFISLKRKFCKAKLLRLYMTVIVVLGMNKSFAHDCYTDFGFAVNEG
jgi:hypothetical protein